MDRVEKLNELGTSPWVRWLMPLPAVLVLVIFCGLVGWGAYSSDSIKNEYRVAARVAIKEEDFKQAKFYYSRLIGEGDEGSTSDQFNMVSVHLAAGDQDEAVALLERLAPDAKPGYRPAHLQRAMICQQAIEKRGPDQSVFEQWRWHLQNGATDGSVQSELLWASYHMAVNQPSEAVLRLTAAAGRNPELWFEIATLYRQTGRTDDAQRAIERAEKHARSRLEESPIDLGQRLRLADILMIRQEYSEVRSLLSDGLRLSGGDPAMRLAASNFALTEIGRLDPNEKDVQKRNFLLLQQAIQLAPENPSAYASLSTFFSMLESAEDRLAYRKTVQDWISQGLSVAYAHFTLANLLWMDQEQDRAIFHFEKALELEPALNVVANNLAWVLAHSETPDFPRAEKLIRTTLEADPKQVRFRDTLAAVLFQAGDYEAALLEYERTLPHTRGDNRRETHQRLAKIYEQLGQTEMAESHLRQVEELATN